MIYIINSHSKCKLLEYLPDTVHHFRESCWRGCFLKILRDANFHSKCRILDGAAKFFRKAFLCCLPLEYIPRPVVYTVCPHFG